LNEKKENLKSKYTFNNFLSGSQLISYNFNKNIKKVDLNSLYKYLKSFFKTLSSLISFPVLEIYPDKIRIRLFYYVVPSKTKKRIHKLLHKYIRSDEKLYKEIILRRNFKSKMEQFKMKLFIAKWKEDNNLIGIPYPISYFKGLSVGQPSVSLNEEALLKNSTSSYAHVHAHAHGHTHHKLASYSSDLLHLEPLSSSTNKNKYPGVIENFRSSNGDFNKPYEYNTSLDLLKLDFSKLSQQYDQLESLLRDLHNITQDNNSKMTDVPGKPLKENIKINKPEDENIIYQSTNLGSQVDNSLISVSRGSVDAKEPILDVYQSFAEQPNKHTESLKILKDRKVSTIVSLNKVKFKYLIFTLEKLFKKTIILDLVRLKYPYHESNILAQVLSLSCKTKDFRQIMRKLLYTATISNPTKMVRTQNFSIIPSYLSGIKVRLGGRLITQRIVPRFTVQSLQIGSLARGKVNFTDSSRITLKNKRGAFSFTVTTSHIFDK
jgi:Mitochondrial ribosomal protein (VAR1)